MSIDTNKAQARQSEVVARITEEEFEAERKWEDGMFERGRQKYLRLINDAKQKGNEGQTDYGMTLIKRAFNNTYDALVKYMDRVDAGKSTNIPIAYKYLRHMNLEVVTFIALRKLMDKVSLQQPLQNVALYIGNEIMFEAKMRALKDGDGDRWMRTQSYLRHSSSRKYKSTVLNFALGKSEYATFEPWPESDRRHIGLKMIDLIHDATGLISIYMDASSVKHKKGFYKISLTHEASNWVSKFCANSEYAHPDIYPTIIPPKPWDSAFDGGYWFTKDNLRSRPLMKTNDVQYLSAVDALIKAGHLNEVVSAVNAIQNTAWTINKDILEVAQAVWNAGGGRAGLTEHEDLHLPLCPVCGADITEEVNARIPHPCLEKLKEENMEAFKEWKIKAKEIRNKNVAIQSKRLSVVKAITMARIMVKYDRFYFPYQLDFRGRIYAMPTYLTPQGEDLGKALLKFADAKPLGSMDAVRWLAVQVANTYGNDKISLDDRYSWVIQNQNKILAAAEDPYDNDFWMDADEPFCFLAACMEWAGYVKDGLSFKSSLPIAMDGSCNGLQLFSLMLHDEVGGAAVNLVPSDKPSDIYGIVAQKVVAQLQKEASDPNFDQDVPSSTGKMAFNLYRDAKALLELPINRKTTKRQVMTLPYGATMQSCIEYTRQWMLEHGDWPDKKEFLRISIVLAQHVWTAIGQTVIKARQAMDYLQDMARVLNKIGKPIYWETPCGLPIKQNNVNYRDREVKTTLGDTIIKLRIKPEGSEGVAAINKTKQVNSISPNFIHSLDATALMKTVCGCTNEDVWSFALIHDSYGTHAADSPKLARILRESFILMFGKGNDILKDFEERIIRQYPEVLEVKGGLPKRPDFGTLNVEDVRNSLYFFA